MGVQQATMYYITSTQYQIFNKMFQREYYLEIYAYLYQFYICSSMFSGVSYSISIRMVCVLEPEAILSQAKWTLLRTSHVFSADLRKKQ